MKIRLVGTEMFQADGETDMTKLMVTFGNFAKAPKNLSAVVSSIACMITV
jgi:hypothetical protein